MNNMHNSKFDSYLDINSEVQNAIDNREPIVALESTIICHGMPFPKNLETAIEVESVVRENGGIPATIAILDGRLKVGISSEEMQFLAEKGKNIKKVSRRDIPFCLANKDHGATTVAATMIISSLANIPIFATGGIGGVHRDINDSLDISADLQELAQTNVAVICSGVKSILDIPKTLEYLETFGIPVIGYKTKTMPAFYNSSSDSTLDHMCNKPEEIAKIISIKWDIPQKGGIVIANPIPEKYSIDKKEIDSVIEDALIEMKKQNITGKKTTPFLLERVAKQTEGKSLKSNIQLVLSNVSLATKISKEFNQMSRG